MSEEDKSVQNVSPNPNYERRQNDDKKIKHISRWIIGVLLSVIIITGIMIYKYVETSLQPVNPHNSTVITVKIPIGSTNKEIAHILEQKRIIKSATVFNMYVKTNNIGDFKAGSYDFKQSDTIKTISTKLQEGGRSLSNKEITGKLVIPEGSDISNIKKIIANKTKFSQKDVETILKDQKFFNALLEKYPALLTSASEAKNVRYRLEGYLYPATYSLYKGITLKEIITTMVQKMNQVLTPYYNQIKDKGFSIQQLLTLASLIEKEGVTDEDRRKISGVFLNRLDIGMPLQSDVAVMYAMNTHKEHLTNKDVSIDSPYNLYKYKGYGPGPFASPSIRSIQAVLNPLDRDKGYLYFVADLKTRKVYYSKNLEEHQQKSVDTGN